MATEADHIRLANKNHETLDYLLRAPEQHPEWITTVAFYKALQIVEAVFVHTDGRGCHSHRPRLEKLKRPKYAALHKHYRTLWNASSIARYLQDQGSNKSYSQFSDYLTPEQVVNKMVRKRLRSIEQIAVSMISDNARSDLVRVPEDSAV